MRRSDAFPSTYFSQADVLEANVIATIRDVVTETIQGERGEEEKPVMHFMEKEAKRLILNSVNWNVCETAYGPDSIDWRGRKVECYHDPGIMFGAKRVGGVRLRIPVGTSVLPPPAAPPRAGTPAAPGPKIGALLGYQDAIAECERNGISKEALLDMLKGEGRTNYLAQRDTALVRGFIAHIIEQQMSAPPAAPDEFEGEQIPF